VEGGGGRGQSTAQEGEVKGPATQTLCRILGFTRVKNNFHF